MYRSANGINGSAHMRTGYALLIAILFSPPSTLSATDLSQQTLKAWDEYIRGADSRMNQRLAGTTTFLWIDESPGRRERVQQGEILVEPVRKDSPEKVPEGLIHDWLGAVFIPNATINSVFAMLNDYDRYDRFYNPAVSNAKLLDISGATRRFSLVLTEKAPFVNAAIASDYTSRTIQFDKQHWYTVTYSTRIQQIDNYGQAGEHELPPDKGAGYIWRLYSIERFEERDGGVYTELEAIALSRNIPFDLQWLVKPILQHLPRSSMVATLQKTREAVCAEGSSEAPDIAELGRPPRNYGTRAALATDRRGLEIHSAPAATSLGIQGQN
jgi:hypothetical protein